MELRQTDSLPYSYRGKNLGDELKAGPSPRSVFYALAFRKLNAERVECGGALYLGRRESSVASNRSRASELVRSRIDEQVGVVEEVEELRAELQVRAFAWELEVLVQPHVEGPEP